LGILYTEKEGKYFKSTRKCIPLREEWNANRMKTLVDEELIEAREKEICITPKGERELILRGYKWL
jgi:hypothetical protein